MSVDKAIDLLDQIAVLVEQTRIELRPQTPPTPPKPVAIKTATDLDRALSSAVPGSVIVCDPSLVYPAPLHVTQQGVTLASALLLPGRMTKDAPAPRFQQGVTSGTGVSLIGLDLRHTDPTKAIVTCAGADILLDRCRVLGDVGKGAHRGVAANGDGRCAITRCYIDDCFGAYPGDDTQAIAAWDMLPGLLIDDCYLSGGSETILIGGSDPKDASRNPSGIIIRKNTITKNPAWKTLLVGVKNTLELKNARHVIIEDNDISQSWGGKGQTGYLLSFKCVNQDGTAPTSSVEDVLVQRNTLHHGAGLLNVQGHDQKYPSGILSRVTLKGNTVTDIDPLAFSGSDKLIQMNGPSIGVMIDSNTITGKNIGAVLYFYGAIPGTEHEGLIVTGNQWPISPYWIRGEGTSVAKPGAMSPGWLRYVKNGVLSGNTEV